MYHKAVLIEGLKPAENHPQVIFLEFRRSPMFFPTMDIAPEDGEKLDEQSSRTGSGLSITVPLTTP
jgi:hypothetical protein